MKTAEKLIWLLGFFGSMTHILAIITVPLMILLYIIFFDRQEKPPTFP